MVAAIKKRRWQAITIWQAVALSALLAALVLAYLIHKFAVNVPYLDDWAVVDLFRHYKDHALTFHDFWMQHNEHRIVFPRLAILLLAIISHWNQLAEIWTSFVLSLITCWVLIRWVRLSLSRYTVAAVVGSILVPWILFSPVQWENWLWGWQIEWFMMVLAAITAIGLVATGRPRNGQISWRRLVLAMVAATIATYSVGNGIFVWPVCLGLLLLQGSSRRHVIAWAAVGVPIAGAYFIGYKSPASSYPPTLIIHQPFAFLQHFAAIVGRPLGYDIISSSAIGIFFIMTFLVSSGYLLQAGREAWQKALPWLGLAAFALLALALISFSRFGAGVNQAMSSRYYIISSLFVMATIMLALLAVAHYRERLRQPSVLGLVAAGAVLLALVLNNYFYGLQLMALQKHNLEPARACAQTASSSTDSCLLTLYPYKQYVWDRLTFVRSIGWGGF